MTRKVRWKYATTAIAVIAGMLVFVYYRKYIPWAKTEGFRRALSRAPFAVIIRGVTPFAEEGFFFAVKKSLFILRR